MDNKTFLEKLKFGIGDGNLQYYLYNWKCPPMDPEKVSYTKCFGLKGFLTGIYKNKITRIRKLTTLKLLKPII